MGIAMQPEEFPRRRRNDPKEQANAFDASQGLRSDDFRTVAPGKGAGGADGRNLPGPADQGAPACGSNHRCTGQGRVAAVLPRFNRRFGVPARCPEPAFRPMGPELRLGHILCFKHRRRVARDNTVKYYRHTLQLLPTQQRRSYAGAVVVVLEGLDGRLSLQPEGRIIDSREAPPGPASLRSRNETSPAASISPPDPELASKPSVTALELPGAKPDQEEGAHAAAIDDPDVAGLRVVASPRRPTLLQQERWKAVQQGKLQGMSIRRMARESGIHRETVRRYIDAESPPTRGTPATPPAPASDTIAD